MPRFQKIPSYCRHKASGQGMVTLNGRDHYLGSYGSPESRQKYERMIAEWLVAGRCLPNTENHDEMTIVELIVLYGRYAETYYLRDGHPTGEVEAIQVALRTLKRLYGREPARRFGPLALKAIRQKMIEEGKCRRSVNDRIGRIKRMFKWAVQNELAPSSVFHGLQSVEGLRRGRCEAHDPDPVRPVADALVDAVLPLVSPVVASMIELQRITGMRSGELVILRGGDLDMSGSVWVYAPQRHKTQHHGHARPIYLGPRAQQIVRPYLKPDLSAYLFSPQEAEASRRVEVHQARKTPLSCGNRPGTNRKRKPKRIPGDRYTTASYRRAIDRGCDAAFPIPDEISREEAKAWRKNHHWHPHQLRHSAATRLRKEFGLEAARVVLGHRSAAVTEIYAEIDGAKAADIMASVG